VQHVWFIAGLVAASLSFALLEVQVEGAAGWAGALPAWRVDNRFTRVLMGGRVLTGYHLYAHLFVVAMVHVPYAMGAARPTWRFEARIAAFLVLFWVLEDFLWFVVNPAFGIRRFRREHVPWHAPGWWWVMPREYWIFVPAACALYAWSR
jgi:hypothetical protein